MAKLFLYIVSQGRSLMEYDAMPCVAAAALVQQLRLPDPDEPIAAGEWYTLYPVGQHTRSLWDCLRRVIEETPHCQPRDVIAVVMGTDVVTRVPFYYILLSRQDALTGNEKAFSIALISGEQGRHVNVSFTSTVYSSDVPYATHQVMKSDLAEVLFANDKIGPPLPGSTGLDGPAKGYASLSTCVDIIEKWQVLQSLSAQKASRVWQENRDDDITWDSAMRVWNVQTFSTETSNARYALCLGARPLSMEQ
eukprot:TRINITY_DN4304_c0_g1_i3.p2 TRINITY_DN4304_c0_g1~~TRINITY_DN4304_c0_g1_i3.p2  ORF type:complete len:250 (-),score=32.86 TRINITY_DN4304_c0_g1_i3:1873-2622(-)